MVDLVFHKSGNVATIFGNKLQCFSKCFFFKEYFTAADVEFDATFTDYGISLYAKYYHYFGAK